MASNKWHSCLSTHTEVVEKQTSETDKCRSGYSFIPDQLPAGRVLSLSSVESAPFLTAGIDTIQGAILPHPRDGPQEEESSTWEWLAVPVPRLPLQPRTRGGAARETQQATPPHRLSPRIMSPAGGDQVGGGVGGQNRVSAWMEGGSLGEASEGSLHCPQPSALHGAGADLTGTNKAANGNNENKEVVWAT